MRVSEVYGHRTTAMRRQYSSRGNQDFKWSKGALFSAYKQEFGWCTKEIGASGRIAVSQNHTQTSFEENYHEEPRD